MQNPCSELLHGRALKPTGPSIQWRKTQIHLIESSGQVQSAGVTRYFPEPGLILLIRPLNDGNFFVCCTVGDRFFQFAGMFALH